MMKPRQSMVSRRTTSCSAGTGSTAKPGSSCEPSNPAISSAEKSPTLPMCSAASRSELGDDLGAEALDALAQDRFVRERPVGYQAVHAQIGETFDAFEIDRPARRDTDLELAEPTRTSVLAARSAQAGEALRGCVVVEGEAVSALGVIDG